MKKCSNILIPFAFIMVFGSIMLGLTDIWTAAHHHKSQTEAHSGQPENEYISIDGVVNGPTGSKTLLHKNIPPEDATVVIMRMADGDLRLVNICGDQHVYFVPNQELFMHLHRTSYHEEDTCWQLEPNNIRVITKGIDRISVPE